MKINRLKITSLILVLIVVAGAKAFAQCDVSSPYSRFGFGDIQSTRLNTIALGMGGISNSLANGTQLYAANPASYASIDSLTFIFDAGLYYKNATYRTKDLSETGSNASLNYANIGFGITKWWKSGLGVSPYTNMEYNVIVALDDDLIDVGHYKNSFIGSGGLNSAYWVNGFRIAKNLSAGLTLSYLFGNMIDETTVYFPDSTFYLNGRRTISNRVNHLMLDFGLLYSIQLGNEKYINIGVTFTPNTDIKAKRYIFVRSMFQGYGDYAENPVDTLLYEENQGVTYSLPNKFGIGVSMRKSDRWMVGMDFNWQNWKSTSIRTDDYVMQNSWNLAVGGEYKAATTSLSGYFKRVTYRAGLHFDRTYHNIYGHSIDKMGVSVGFGLPIMRTMTSCNIAIEFGTMGTTSDNLVKENYFNISVGMSIRDKWFVKRKYE